MYPPPSRLGWLTIRTLIGASDFAQRKSIKCGPREKKKQKYQNNSEYDRPQRSIETIASFDQWSGTIKNH